LTEQEKKIAKLIEDGKTNKEIAQILNTTVRTIETHRKNIMRKTGQHNVAELINWKRKNMV
jgi:DNA-binding CsgD family transcriptional regulator